MRFNPPPNWPPAPPGWAPDPAWQPDPAWGPPPPGWPLWVDDAAAGAPPPGYPGSYPGAPYPGGFPGAVPPPQSRKGLWLALAAVAAVVLIAAGALLIVNLNKATTGSGTSQKPDITELTKDLLVDRSQFPDLGGGEFQSSLNDGPASDDDVLPDDITVSPQACADLFGGPKTATEHATARLADRGTGGMRSVGVHLALGGDPVNLHDYLDKCQTFTITTDLPGLDKTMTLDGTVEPFDPPGLPSWAVAYRTKTSSSLPGLPVSTMMEAAAVSGYYRGVLVEASTEQMRSGLGKQQQGGTDLADDLVKLFNAQVQKLEDAA